jgi:bacterioferritin-associated ferredoxin
LATFEKTHIVCECTNVTLGEILYAIERRGAKTIEDVQKLTDAGVTCKCCTKKEDDVSSEKLQLYIDQILNKFNKS